MSPLVVILSVVLWCAVGSAFLLAWWVAYPAEDMSLGDRLAALCGVLTLPPFIFVGAALLDAQGCSAITWSAWGLSFQLHPLAATAGGPVLRLFGAAPLWSLLPAALGLFFGFRASARVARLPSMSPSLATRISFITAARFGTNIH